MAELCQQIISRLINCEYFDRNQASLKIYDKLSLEKLGMNTIFARKLETPNNVSTIAL